MTEKKTLIINHRQIKQKARRIAFQILEDNFEEKDIVLVGIADRGYIFSQRILEHLQDIAPDKTISLVKAHIGKTKRKLDGKIDQDHTIAENKVVIVVDDVLNSGKTLAYALGLFINTPLKKMRTAVLVDRCHHTFPIRSDFYGIKLSTTLKEHVQVCFTEEGFSEDAAWLF